VAIEGIGKKFTRKTAVYTTIWTIVGIFSAYTLFSVGKPYWIAYFFKKEVQEVGNSEVLGGIFYDDELVGDILDSADYHGVFCNENDIDIIEQGRRRQLDVRFSVPFSYFGYHTNWFFKTRSVGWEDVGRPIYK